MSLASLRKSITKDATLALAKKAKTAKTAKRQVTGGNSLIDKIKRAVDFTENVLGNHRNEYQLIRNKNDLIKYVDVAIANKIISIDTETTGLDPISDSIVGVCIYTPTQKPAYIPINHQSYITNTRVNDQLTENEVSEEIQRLIDNDVKFIFFNAKFDIRVMRHHLNVDVPPAWDGFIAAKCLNELEKENSLKYLHKIYCGNAEEAHYTFDKLFKDIKFSLIPINTAYLYAAKDALMTHELYEYQKEFLTPESQKCIDLDYTRLASLYNNIELPLIPIVADIEDAGICLDLDLAKQLSEKYHKMLDDKKQEIYQVINKYSSEINDYKKTVDVCKLDDPINIGSPVQLAILLYDILKLPIVDKASPRGTGEPILEKLDHEICKHILEYRGIAKLVTTYIDKMPNALNPITHKIHCNFHQIGADTGRFSSSDPNMQNIPSHNKDIRRMFIASKFADVQCEDNIFVFLEGDEIPCEQGYVKAEKLHTGDIINCYKEKAIITNVSYYEKNIIVTVERR